jgi:ribonuclease Z
MLPRPTVVQRMRALYAFFLALVLIGAGPAPIFRVTLLGSGTPEPSITRFSASTLVEVGGKRLIFDFGRGVTMRLWQLHVPLGSIDAGFLTHFHSDHLVGLPDLWLTGWLRPAYGGRNTPFVLYGPPGTKALTDGLTKAFAEDISTREADEHDPPAGIAFETHEIAPGLVYDTDGIKVYAFVNDHGELVKPSYGYKITYGGHTVVLAGDTRFSPAVVAQAKGADLFVHPVTFIPDALLASTPAYQAVYNHLASPEDAARAFTLAAPKMAALSHIGLNGGSTENDLIERIRRTYSGPLTVGRDLMSFEIGDNITVHAY